MTLSLDLETYSNADLSHTGITKYVASKEFDILLCAFAIDDSPVRVLDLSVEEDREYFHAIFLSMLLDRKYTKSAYNASFEIACLSQYFNLSNYDYCRMLNTFTCTMAQAAYCSLPIGLGATGVALGIPDDKKKIAIGRKLIDVFCKPSKKALAGERVIPSQEPEKWGLFKAYCAQDVEAERAIQHALQAHPLPSKELALWRHTCRMNALGVAVDLELVFGAVALTRGEDTRLTVEGQALGLDNPNSLQQLKVAVNEALAGIEEVSVLRKADVEALIDKYPDNERLQALLNNRLAGGKSSLAKYPAILAAQMDGRVHDITMYYGASRTGRFAGRGVQPQNLPRNYLKNLSIARTLVKQVNTEGIKLLFGDVKDTLSQLIRTAFVPAPGHCFLVADFSAIEARVIAWLANEKWVMDVFAGDGKIYEATASQMFGVPKDKIRHGNPEYALRQKGKVAVLALGYAGSTGALAAMGALRMGLAVEDLPEIVNRWRGANPNIVQLWQDIGDAAMTCVDTCSTVKMGQFLTFRMEQVNGIPAMTVELPAGRKLYYLKPQIVTGGKFNRPSLHYLDALSGGKQIMTATFNGKLSENAVQAIARDCLCVTLMRLEGTGYKAVMHIHDEVVLEASEDADLQPVLDIMAQPISWAPGLVLRGAGFKTTEYYMKD